MLDQEWTRFLDACGFEPLIMPNTLADPARFALRMGVTGVILTGGNNLSGSVTTMNHRPIEHLPTMDDLAPERDKTETALLHASVERKLPVLAACRGMQILNVFHGGRIRPVEGHVGHRHLLTRCASMRAGGTLLFDDKVNSFHDYGMSTDDIAPGFEILARAGDVVEAVVHRTYPHFGIMWHPERNAPFSKNDINLFHGVFGT